MTKNMMVISHQGHTINFEYMEGYMVRLEKCEGT